MKKGYSYSDLYDLSYYFSTTFTDMLKEFEETIYGYPQCEFEEVDTYKSQWLLKNYDEIIISLKTHPNFVDVDVYYSDYPMDDPYIKWRLILRRIIWCLQEGNRDYESEYWKEYWDILKKHNMLFEQKLNKDNKELKLSEVEKRKLKKLQQLAYKDDLKFDSYKRQNISEAFNLIAKYYFNLWD